MNRAANGRSDDSLWVNWSEDVSVRPWRHYYPNSLEDLCQVVRSAENQNPSRGVHASGSHWAFSAPAASTGFAIETSRLHRSLDTEITHNLQPTQVAGGCAGIAMTWPCSTSRPAWFCTTCAYV